MMSMVIEMGITKDMDMDLKSEGGPFHFRQSIWVKPSGKIRTVG